MAFITEREMIVVSPGMLHGEVATLNAAATQFPALACKYIFIKALASNAGNVYIGTSSSVTATDGSADATTGYELDAGDEIILPLANGNADILWHIGSASGGFTYFALG